MTDRAAEDTDSRDPTSLPVRVAGAGAREGVHREELYCRVSPEVDIFVRHVAPAKPAATEGNRRHIWLLHGAGMDSLGFDIPVPGWSFMERLARRGHEIFACDYRGHGRSTRVADGAGIDAAVVRDDVAFVVRQLATSTESTADRAASDPEVHLVGISFGSVVAPMIAKELGARIGSMTLLGPIFASLGAFGDDFAAFVEGLTTAPCGYAFTTEEEWSELFLASAEPAVLRWHEVCFGTAYAYPIGPYNSVASLPVDTDLSTVTCPTRAIMGDRDPFASVDDMDHLFSLLGTDDTALIVQENVGHLPYVEAHASSVIDTIDAIVSGRPS